MFQILLVEDDRELNKTVCAYLNQNGYETTGCLSANEAYDAMYGGTLFDLIISDIMMPVMNGLDATKAIRGLSRPDAPTVPIIALSANAFAEDIQKSKNAGINEHLAKPLEMDKVLKVIASYCK